MVYPPSGSVVDVRDSSFLLGSVGDGTAQLLLNGDPVPVAPNGAWLAWVPFPGRVANDDSLIIFRLEARTLADSAVLEHVIRRAAEFRPPTDARLWVDTTSFFPRGRVWWPREEPLELRVRAAEGATAALRLPGGGGVLFQSLATAGTVPVGVRAFERDSIVFLPGTEGLTYRTRLRPVPLGADPGPPLGEAPDTPADSGAGAVLELVRGADTLRVPWPLRLALLDTLSLGAEVNDDVTGTGLTDRVTPGRAAPGATYHWFLSNGVRAPILGRRNGDVRLRLSGANTTWVAVADLVAADVDGGPAVVGSIAVAAHPDRIVARIPVGRIGPLYVDESERALTLTLYGAVADINWLQYGPEDPLLRLVTWRQIRADEVEIRFELAQPVWGYRTRWDGGDLLFEIRRPPAIDPRRPLTGRVIVVDPGHPPAGATGPTGLREAEANLGVAGSLARLLRSAGATVHLTRTDDSPVDLWARVRFADSAGAEVLVSIHNNALPDGVNPFRNNGTSVYYNHPRALPLARSIQARLAARLGIRNLGVGRGDLALARPTWMPAVLTEGLFMMVPEQEHALRTEEGRDAYARAVLEGLERWLAGRARGAW